MKNKLEKHVLDAMSKDPGNWRGFFYVNSKDPRIIVPKLFPVLGWTLNFGNIYGYVAIIAILAIVVGSQFM